MLLFDGALGVNHVHEQPAFVDLDDNLGDVIRVDLRVHLERGKRIPDQIVDSRAALPQKTAHTVHPLEFGGQTLNLGEASLIAGRHQARQPVGNRAKSRWSGRVECGLHVLDCRTEQPVSSRGIGALDGSRQEL